MNLINKSIKMGVPKLFKTLTNRYPKILFSKLQPKTIIHHLFFDLNCLIHPVCAKHNDKTEIEMFEEIYNYIEYVKSQVENHLCSTSKIYLFMDGVAPFAKILQQRQRRFRAKNTNTNSTWDSNAISPETYFMINLTKFLETKYISNQSFVISSTNQVGEGEHKIVDYLMNNVHSQQNICIYGLDADLILLSWCVLLKKHTMSLRLYLIREVQNFGIFKSTEKFHFMSINELLKSFMNECKGNVYQECVDFILLTIFLGNDFLPNLFGVSLNFNGLDILLNNYRLIKSENPNYFLVDITNYQQPISIQNLEYFFVKLSSIEKQIYVDFCHHYLEYRPKAPKFKNENEKINFEESLVKDIKLPFDIYNEFFQKNYSKRYFQISNPLSTYDNCLVVDRYIAGLIWIIKYYFKLQNQLSFGYIYPYVMSPTISMICQRFKSIHRLNFEQFTNHCSLPIKPFHPFIALSLILPKKSHHLFDSKKVIGLETDIDEEYEMCTDFKHFIHECPLIFEEIDWKKYKIKYN